MKTNEGKGAEKERGSQRKGEKKGSWHLLCISKKLTKKGGMVE